MGINTTTTVMVSASFAKASYPRSSSIIKRVHAGPEMFSAHVGQFGSGHPLINLERKRRNLPTLARSTKLDKLARQHALCMAQQKSLFPSCQTVSDLRQNLNVDEQTRVGESVYCGSDLRMEHQLGMDKRNGFGALAYRANVLNKSYTKVGFGTAKGADGLLYM